MLGGSSGLNGLSFAASAKAVVNGWAELGNPGWEWPAFSHSLAKTYTVAKAPPSTMKTSSEGPLKLTFADDYTGGWSKVWAKTIEGLGYPGARDSLAGQATGGLMIPDTVDPTMEIRGRANLTVLTGVEVNKVLVNKPNSGDGRGDAVVTGVEFTNPTKSAKETLSGIGDARRLGAANVVVDSPGVGENLQNHRMTTGSIEVVDAAPATKDAFLRAALRQDMASGGPMQEYMERHTGLFASSGVTSAAQFPLPGLDTPEGKRDFEGLLAKIETGAGGISPFTPAHERFIRSILSSPSEASGYYIFGPATSRTGRRGAPLHWELLYNATRDGRCRRTAPCVCTGPRISACVTRA
ncbi:hypothetical protein F4779DRAFT_625748 [Xylariaceae sp. FL0662B]|nr:hypothetical protein F4779DRAFT_625748 [Xylariaceae sp. FL0662B]